MNIPCRLYIYVGCLLDTDRSFCVREKERCLEWCHITLTRGSLRYCVVAMPVGEPPCFFVEAVWS